MNLIVSLRLVTISGLGSDLKCTCGCGIKMLSPYPEDYELDGYFSLSLTHLQRLHGKLVAHRRMNWHCIFF